MARVRALLCGGGHVGRDIGGGLAGNRFWRFDSGRPASELVPEQAQPAPAAVACAAMGVAAGRAVPQRVRRVCAGGLALVDQVVAILADRGRLAAGLPEPASGGAAAAGGPPRAAKSFGYLLLWILVIGFLGLAGWRLVQAAVRRLNLTEGHRVRALVYGIGYAMAFLSTLMFVVHGTKPAGVIVPRGITPPMCCPSTAAASSSPSPGSRLSRSASSWRSGASSPSSPASAHGVDEPRYPGCGQARPGGIRRARWSSPASGSLPWTRRSPMMQPRPRASTGCSAPSPSHLRPLAAHPRRTRTDRVRDLVIRRGEVAPHPWRSPCLSKCTARQSGAGCPRLRP
jgi:hypothetical protein